MGLTIITKTVKTEYGNYHLLMEQRRNLIAEQMELFDGDSHKAKDMETEIRANRRKHHEWMSYNKFAMKQTKKRVARTDLPLSNSRNYISYSFNEGIVHDAIRLRYGWQITTLPSKCACGESFNIQRAPSCKKDGFFILRHSHLCNIKASLLKYVCKYVIVKPSFNP